jgi:hypothetical protein
MYFSGYFWRANTRKLDGGLVVSRVVVQFRTFLIIESGGPKLDISWSWLLLDHHDYLVS